MPIVDGRYEAKISTTFETPEDGIDEIKKRINKSRKIRINGIPMGLLDELKPLLEKKDLKIILPLGEKPSKDLKELCDVGTTKAKIYAEFGGQEVNTGSVAFPSLIYNIIWLGDEILQISALEYSSCVKCMLESFEGGWRYSKKW
ncbi:MAG: hypothetical protein JSV43_06450 [Methanobacteriota archaeon]|nr:MAG: hypothetical protein JSV43_06450 [Euryarchaeota archaeon]